MLSDTTLTRLANWMTGAFSSQAQAQADPAYFDIRLHVVRIWPERKDGYWLYIEQAAADSQERPYRQRVYHLTRLDEHSFESAVFSFAGDPLVHAGAWQAVQPLAALQPEDLEERHGCAVVLKQLDEHQFAGSTQGRECESNLRGASYATSQVTVTAERLTSWDQGFDTEGKQVWGAEAGPYLFDKLENYPLS
ncbi:MAG: chromophore lyase CpcT/CpeT [Anaerolineales bacterium]|nr:chromophore lyase CpcT/CpeT [Anaerolineales bacterium]